MMLFPNRELKCCSCCFLVFVFPFFMFLAVWIHFVNVSLGFLVKGTVLQYHTSNRTKQDVNKGILTFKVPMFKAWFLKTFGTLLIKMGHGIEQAIMRLVRSTSVTLKVLKSHDSDVLWRVQLLSSATVSAFENLPSWKVGATIEKLFYATLPQKANTKKAKTKTASKWACLKQHSVRLPAKRSDCFCLRRGLVQTSPGSEKSQRRDPRSGLQASHWRHVRRWYPIWEEPNLVWLPEPETTYTSKPHSSFSFFLSFFLFKYVTGILTENAV